MTRIATSGGVDATPSALEALVDARDGGTVPELTVTADGLHRHPVGGDLGAAPDVVVARGDVPLAQAERLVVDRSPAPRRDEGTLHEAFRCAV